MSNLIERIWAKTFEIGRGANETLDLLFRSNDSNPPGFRRAGSSSEMMVRSNGRSTFRRLEMATASISSNTVLTEADHNKTLLVNTTAARQITLPAPAAGLMFHIKDATGSAGVNNITIVRNGSESIDGVAASAVLNINRVSRTIVSDGSNWFWIGQDYSEGDWTPIVKLAGTSQTLSNLAAKYVKVGRLVTLESSFTFQRSVPGIVSVEGLPFVSLNVANLNQSSIIFVINNNYTTSATNMPPFTVRVPPNSSGGPVLFQAAGAAPDTTNQLNGSSFASSVDLNIRIFGQYISDV